MSKSRRSLLAAGLATAVVGATGVAWTLSADAAETPRVETPPVVAAPLADAVDDPEPPELLPWGAKPTKIKQARVGASSKEVAAAGAGAAPPAVSDVLDPESADAPKGGIGPNGELRSAHTSVVPPRPPDMPGAALADEPVAYFSYASGNQAVKNQGSWASLTIHKPTLATDDYHTLAEIAVRSADQKNVVEVGWNVDRGVNKDEEPHLFVYHWVDGEKSCYNCKLEPYPKPKPGDPPPLIVGKQPGPTLPLDTQKRFGIQHDGNKWWIAYDTNYVGYFPDSLWAGAYTESGLVQWFGEVASTKPDPPCSQMGSGLAASSGRAARIGSISIIQNVQVDFTNRTTYPNLYSTAPVLREPTKPPNDPANIPIETFRYGGPGRKC